MRYLRSALNIQLKGRINLVTEADVASEKLIASRIQSRYPQHQMLPGNGGLQSSYRRDNASSVLLATGAPRDHLVKAAPERPMEQALRMRKYCPQKAPKRSDTIA